MQGLKWKRTTLVKLISDMFLPTIMVSAQFWERYEVPKNWLILMAIFLFLSWVISQFMKPEESDEFEDAVLDYAKDICQGIFLFILIIGVFQFTGEKYSHVSVFGDTVFLWVWIYLWVFAFIQLLFYLYFDYKGYPQFLQEKLSKNRIKELREIEGLSQEELGKFVGVRGKTVAHMENGQYTPSFKLAMKIAEVLHTPIEEIFTFEEEKN